MSKDAKIEGRLLFFSLCDYGPSPSEHPGKRFEVSAGFKCSSKDDRFPDTFDTEEQALEEMEEELHTLHENVRKRLKRIRSDRFKEESRQFQLIRSKAKKR